MTWVIAFVSMFALDFVWAKYTHAVQLNRAFAAANAAVGIMLCNAVVTVGYVNDVWLIVPTAAGAFAGTYYAVKRPRA